MQEIISKIFQIIDFKTLKECHLVCRKWCRIATEFLFRRVVHHRENSKYFNEIIARDNLSVLIRVISIGRAVSDDTMVDLRRSILSHQTLRQLVVRPTVGVIRQRHQREFITTLTGMDSQNTPLILPALEEIRLITSEEPYMPTQLFSELRKLHIDMETIRLPDDLAWPSLVDLHLRGIIDIDYLEDFLKNYKDIRQLHIAIVSSLRPLGPSSDPLHQLLRGLLNSRLDTELAGSIMRHAEKNADGHERLLLQDIHAQLDKMTDEKTAKEMHQAIVTVFKTLLKYELDRYSIDIGKMRIPLENLSQLEVSCSIAYFWEDELAIKGITLPEDYASKSGLWINDEIKESLGISHVYQRIGST